MVATTVCGDIAAGESAGGTPRGFEFDRDTFAFANELVWEYRFDALTGKTTFTRREPKPDYTHRCFVLARSVRQFFYHARFDERLPMADDGAYRGRVREVIARSPRARCGPGQEVVFPGYASLRRFSQARERLLKDECGGAWESYFLRSHWRMVFPISRRHQLHTADRLIESVHRSGLPIVHLVRFPALSINHGMVLFGVTEAEGGACFQAYDPNDPEKPTSLALDRADRSFALPANRYWAGGRVNVILIYRRWFF